MGILQDRTVHSSTEHGVVKQSPAGVPSDTAQGTAGTRLPTRWQRRLGIPKIHLQGFVGTVRTMAPAAGGWLRSSMAGVQDDSAPKTMAARAASDWGEPFLKATCDRLALFDQHGGFDGDGRWPARHFSSDILLPTRRQIALTFFQHRTCALSYVCAQIQRGRTTRAVAGL